MPAVGPLLVTDWAAADHRRVDTDLVVKVCLVVAVLVTLWLLPDLGNHHRRAARVVRTLRGGEPAPPRPSGPPVEQIAADIRRIRTQLDRTPPGMPVARRRGWVEAYDDVLVAACRALDLEERISTTPEGVRRDLERERVERLLVRAGLQVRSPR